MKCGRVHLGPVIVENFRQICQACGRVLGGDERRIYWRVRRRILELKMMVLRLVTRRI